MTDTLPPISHEIWDMKYRFKTADGTPIDTTIEDTWRRIAGALAEVEAEPALWEDRFYRALEDFKFLPAGRITAGAGTGRSVTLFNCFVMGTVPDDMGGIFDGLKEAALTMQQGGGIGYDFSTLRPKGAEVKGVAADASGPLTFMDVWDGMCRTIMSAGSRRGAMMGTMRCDHPDVEDFIEAKKDPARLRMFNLSVLITDPFMDAVKADGPWELVFSGKVYKTLQARDLWNKIMRNTYDFAEPGVIFIDRINKANNLSYCETIAATNPCVPAGTQILTKQGWWAIDEVVGREVETWNGIEWSPVTPAVTGRDQQLVTVKLSDGRELTCTPAHRFVLQDQTRRNASDLRVGDKLVSGRWPVIKGHVDYTLAYDQGFFSGDGTEKKDGQQYIYLYGDKKQLEVELAGALSRGEYAITGGYEGTDLTQTKVYLNYGKRMFLPKSFVPSAEWDIESRLRWLEGVCDSDGCAYRSYNSVLVQISAKNRDFLRDIMLMLNTLGIGSNLSEMKDYWRLGISASNVARLQDLGFAPKRLDISGNNPQRECARFARVVSVEVLNKIADKVFCFTENRRHMGVFNGVLTGQCGEQPLPPYGACLLGSINMPTLVSGAFTDDAAMDVAALEDLVRLAVRMMDNVVDASRFPLPAQEVEARAKRRIGLGVTGLADALLMVGLRYGSPEAAAQTEKWMHAIARASYLASVDLAKEKGAFPLFDADAYLASGNMMQMDADVRDAIRTHGIRNALLTSIAPTGTISLYAGNVSSGIEPVFAYAYTRKVLQKDGSRTEEAVVDYAVRLWRQLKGETALPDYFVNAQTLAPLDHVRMQAAAQKWIDSSISKTINCPEAISFEDFQQVYMAAWDQGCKGCTTYRPNDVTGSVLSVPEAPKKETIHPSVEITARPEALDGATYKIKWPANEHAMYVTINDIVENGERRPFEVFINSKNMEHFAWTVALTRMISAVFRRPHDSRFVAEELKAVFDPKGGAWVEGKYIPSVLAAIGGVIERHMIAIGYIADIRPAMIDDGGHVIEVVNAPGGMVSEPRKGDEMCPKCFSGNVKHEAGCFQCIDCGHSKCG